MLRQVRLYATVGLAPILLCAWGQTISAQTLAVAPSSLVEEDPAASPADLPRISTAPMARNEPDRIAPRPFSSLGVGVYLGTEGVGLQLASPLSARLNLRAGASGATFNPDITDDGFNIVGDIRLLNAFVGVDILPFFYRLHSLRITPGVTLYNGSRMRAHYSVPGGQAFDLGYGNFISDPADPVRGDFNLDFGRKVAPRLTVGFGNISPRRGQRWSIPFEIGAEYIGRQPRISLNLVGSTCDATSCTSVASDPDAQKDLAQEQVDLNGNIPPALRFLPIVSIGLAYRFGH